MIQNVSMEKLKSKFLIDLVFKKGRILKYGYLALHYLEEPAGKEKMFLGVGVPKRFVQLAFKRNRIKRQIRAIIEQHKSELLVGLKPGSYMILYKGKSTVDSHELSKDFKGLLKLFTT